MRSDKELKKYFKKKAQEEPEKYYPFEALKELGFSRKKCATCNTLFWTTTERTICDDPQCVGVFRFIGDPPTSKKLQYVDVWREFAKIFKRLGYTPISRYPVVARWNPTMEYTIASIAAFQPHVVSGEVAPPANPLVIPQLCLRFNDIDNVGITGHLVLFSMLGQHAFVPSEEYDMNKYLKEIFKWLNEGLGLEKKEITFHEDAWAGGGNVGSCMEFFCRGLEVGNQVYMQYEQTSNGKIKELSIKVLDMGMGQERNVWLSQGTATVYDAIFPGVMQYLYKATGKKPDEEFMRKFVPYAAQLNVDEVEDIEKPWKEIAEKLDMSVQELRDKVLPLAALYSIAEHSRALLVALNDGALPSNTGGGYNLRILTRRCFGFINKYGWNIDVYKVCERHAQALKQQCPELMQNLDIVQNILEVEKEKWAKTKEKTGKIIEKLGADLDENKLLELYDSQGISPEMIPNIKIPDDFYAKVTERHEQKVQKAATVKEDQVDLQGVEATEALYFEDYKLLEFKGKVLKTIGDAVVLDKTAFYPTSGGQMHDKGKLNDSSVIEVWKQGNVILHRVANINFNEGDVVKGVIDKERRLQIAQHHTATHIINAAAKKVLGNHVNQAGAFKDVDKARIDLTHYASLTDEELIKIEEEANKIVMKGIPIEKKFYSRNEAEQKFGMSIYQGGVPVGKELRIVNIKDTDVECCGGTHLDNTRDTGKIKILKSTKVQDGVIRIVFTAGKAAMKEEKASEDMLLTVQGLLGCDKVEQIPGRAEELFQLWKKVVKKKKDVEKKLVSVKEYHGDIVVETARVLKTQPEHVVKTIKRFLKELGI